MGRRSCWTNSGIGGAAWSPLFSGMKLCEFGFFFFVFSFFFLALKSRPTLSTVTGKRTFRVPESARRKSLRGRAFVPERVLLVMIVVCWQCELPRNLRGRGVRVRIWVWKWLKTSFRVSIQSKTYGICLRLVNNDESAGGMYLRFRKFVECFLFIWMNRWHDN